MAIVLRHCNTKRICLFTISSGDQSLFVALGPGGFGGRYMVLGGATEGDQSPPTEYKGGGGAREGES